MSTYQNWSACKQIESQIHTGFSLNPPSGVAYVRFSKISVSTVGAPTADCISRYGAIKIRNVNWEFNVPLTKSTNNPFIFSTDANEELKILFIGTGNSNIEFIEPITNIPINPTSFFVQLEVNFYSNSPLLPTLVKEINFPLIQNVNLSQISGVAPAIVGVLPIDLKFVSGAYVATTAPNSGIQVVSASVSGTIDANITSIAGIALSGASLDVNIIGSVSTMSVDLASIGGRPCT